jgi:hypothetical protein
MDQDANEGKTFLRRANQLFRPTTHPAAQIEAKRRAVMPPMTSPPAPTPRGLQEADQARAFQAAWEAGWKAGRSAGWQEGWDLRSAVDVIVWYVNSRVDL